MPLAKGSGDSYVADDPEGDKSIPTSSSKNEKQIAPSEAPLSSYPAAKEAETAAPQQTQLLDSLLEQKRVAELAVQQARQQVLAQATVANQQREALGRTLGAIQQLNPQAVPQQSSNLFVQQMVGAPAEPPSSQAAMAFQQLSPGQLQMLRNLQMQRAAIETPGTSATPTNSTNSSSVTTEQSSHQQALQRLILAAQRQQPQGQTLLSSTQQPPPIPSNPANNTEDHTPNCLLQ